MTISNTRIASLLAALSIFSIACDAEPYTGNGGKGFNDGDQSVEGDEFNFGDEGNTLSIAGTGNVGSVEIDQKACVTYIVTNGTDESHDLSIALTGDEVFSTTATAISIGGAGSVADLTVCVEPTDVGLVSSTLTVTTADGGWSANKDIIATGVEPEEDGGDDGGTGGDTGTVDRDVDGDGYVDEALGGDDCDDNDNSVHPGATETWYDGIDSDCDGASDYDADGDGHDSSSFGGGDCDDSDASVNPSATDTWYDGIDSDCDGASDYDADGDGHDSSSFGGGDCDDSNSSINPGTTETWYDGVDSDCDGWSDYDRDGDGYDSSHYGGDDCNDSITTGADYHPGATEVWYDGNDQNCDGADDYDMDGDGSRPYDYGGEDCDDTDSSALGVPALNGDVVEVEITIDYTLEADSSGYCDDLNLIYDYSEDGYCTPSDNLLIWIWYGDGEEVSSGSTGSEAIGDGVLTADLDDDIWSDTDRVVYFAIDGSGDMIPDSEYNDLDTADQANWTSVPWVTWLNFHLFSANDSKSMGVEMDESWVTSVIVTSDDGTAAVVEDPDGFTAWWDANGSNLVIAITADEACPNQ